MKSKKSPTFKTSSFYYYQTNTVPVPFALYSYSDKEKNPVSKCRLFSPGHDVDPLLQEKFCLRLSLQDGTAAAARHSSRRRHARRRPSLVPDLLAGIAAALIARPTLTRFA